MNTRQFGIVMAAALFSGMAASAQDTPSGEVKKAEARRDESKAKAKESAADPLAQVLQDAAAAIKTVEEGLAKSNPSDFPSFELRRLGEPKAATLLAIGTAQAKVGDVGAARKNWQTAADLAGEISDPEERVRFLEAIAVAQNDSGDQDEARDTLQQAARSVRLIRNDLKLPAGLRAPFEEDPAQQKASALGIIAAAQAKIGDKSSARKTFDQAIEAAETIKDNIKRASLLAEIAELQSPEAAKGTWERVTRFTGSLADEAQKAKAFEFMVRTRARIGDVDEVLRIVRDELKGDLKAYCLWALADEAATGDTAPAAKVVAQLLAIAEKTEFERNSKKAKVFTRIAQGQARLGEADAAYKTLGVIQPDNAELRFSALQAKVQLMRDVARGQLKNGSKEAAKDTLQVAMEIVDPYLAEGGSHWFPVAELAELLVEAGDPQGALQTAEAIENSSSKIDVLAAVAAVQGQAGDRAGALATLEKAHRAIKHIPNESLWMTADSAAREFLARRISSRRARTFARQKQLSFDFSLVPSALQATASAHAKIGDFDGALKTAAELSDREDFPFRSERTNAYCNIAIAQAKAKDFKGALMTLEAIAAGGSIFDDERNDAVIEIAGEQVKAGDAKGVLGWAMTQPSAGAKLVALQGLAQGITALKTPKKANESGSTPAR